MELTGRLFKVGSLLLLLGGVKASYAAGPSCEISDLQLAVEDPGLNVDRFAERLANFRISIRQMPESDAKSTALKEYETKFAELTRAAGSREKALIHLQKALEVSKSLSSKNNILQHEREREKRKQTEFEAITNWTKSRVLRIMEHEIRHSSFTPDGSKVVIISNDGVKILELKTLKETRGPYIPTKSLLNASMSPDGSKLVTIGGQGELRMLDLNTMLEINVPSLRSMKFTNAFFSSDGSKLVTEGYGNANILNLANLDSIHKSYHGGWFGNFWITPDGGKLLVKSNHDLKMIDLDTSEEVSLPNLHGGDEIAHSTVTPDGSKLVTANSEGEVKILNLQTMKEIPVSYKHGGSSKRLSITRDGTLLLIVTDAGVKMLNLKTMQEVQAPLNHSPMRDNFFSMTPDGGSLVTSTWNQMKIIDLESRREKLAPFQPPGEIQSAVMSPDGSKVITTFGMGMLAIWFRDPKEAELWD